MGKFYAIAIATTIRNTNEEGAAGRMRRWMDGLWIIDELMVRVGPADERRR